MGGEGGSASWTQESWELWISRVIGWSTTPVAVGSGGALELVGDELMRDQACSRASAAVGGDAARGDGACSSGSDCGLVAGGHGDDRASARRLEGDPAVSPSRSWSPVSERACSGLVLKGKNDSKVANRDLGVSYAAASNVAAVADGGRMAEVGGWWGEFRALTVLSPASARSPSGGSLVGGLHP